MRSFRKREHPPSRGCFETAETETDMIWIVQYFEVFKTEILRRDSLGREGGARRKGQYCNLVGNFEIQARRI
jgi:hypothetical protein